jgi:hypothetical protein
LSFTTNTALFSALMSTARSNISRMLAAEMYTPDTSVKAAGPGRIGRGLRLDLGKRLGGGKMTMVIQG